MMRKEAVKYGAILGSMTAKAKRSKFGKFVENGAGLEKEQQQTIGYIRGMLSEESTNERWRGLIAVPPTSILESIVGVFQQETNIPLEIPFFSLMGMLAGYLQDQDVKYKFEGVEDWVCLWILILATSGSAKTFALDYFIEVFDLKNDVQLLGTFNSSAQFVQRLVETPTALWVQDEFGPFLFRTSEQSYMQEITGFMLDISTHKDIDKRTNSNPDRLAKNPVLSLLAYSVFETFLEDANPKLFETGLFQRIGLIWAKPDPLRKPEDFPRWSVRKQEHVDTLRRQWEKLKGSIKHKTYFLEDESESILAFDTVWAILFPRAKLKESFMRRLIYGMAVKYAVIYHLILGKGAVQTIDAEDVGWGARVIAMHIDDLGSILEQKGLGVAEEKLQKIEAKAEQIRAEHGRELNLRDITRGFNWAKDPGVARAYFALYQETRIGTPEEKKAKVRGADEICDKLAQAPTAKGKGSFKPNIAGKAKAKPNTPPPDFYDDDPDCFE